MLSLQSPSVLLPEMELYLGDHIIDMWLKQGPGTTAPHWAFAWAGGIALARYTLDSSKRLPLTPTVDVTPLQVNTVGNDTVNFTDKTVLDIGPGSGINTVAAVMAGAKHVYSSDWESRSRDLVSWNAEHNNMTDKVTVTDTFPPLDTVDIILLGDVFYEGAADLIEVLDKAFTVNPTVDILVGGAKRDYTPLRRLHLLESYIIPNMDLLEAQSKVPAYVYRYLNNR